MHPFYVMPYHVPIDPDFLYRQLTSSLEGRLTSQETLGFSRLCIPILSERHNSH